MGRAPWIDYSLPRYWLVTLRKAPGVPPFTVLARDHEGMEETPVTRAFRETFRRFLRESPGVAELNPAVVMPDHLHFIIRLSEDPARLRLPAYVSILMRRLRDAHRAATGIAGPVFESAWHDLLVRRAGQLARFRHYVNDNPRWARLRAAFPDRLRRTPAFRHWRLPVPADLFGDPSLLDAPDLLPLRLSRRLLPGTPEWEAALAPLARWRPGMAAVGTWRSRAEQEALRRIAAAGGLLLALEPEGIGPRWHPSEFRRQLTAEGRLLSLSPYPFSPARLPPGLTRRRCLELNALARLMARRDPPEALGRV